MSAGRIFGRGIAFPPRVGSDGRVAWSEGEANVREAIRIILMTERRERIRLPDFGGGVGLYLFEPNTVATRARIKDWMTRALKEWEPRIVVESIAVEEDPEDRQAAVATITYKLVATQALQAIRVSVTLNG
ncbi:MAG TPA: GPW/gp25 family protein [Pyrinomonadaceae bacterium]|nr:GPW/gp25 family protein [Pyrinomonadaceae bacterium]